MGAFATGKSSVQQFDTELQRVKIASPLTSNEHQRVSALTPAGVRVTPTFPESVKLEIEGMAHEN